MGEFSMGEALKQFLKESKLKGGIQALEIEDAWEKIMGKTIAKYTDSIKIINHTLFIKSSVAPIIFYPAGNPCSYCGLYRGGWPGLQCYSEVPMATNWVATGSR